MKRYANGYARNNEEWAQASKRAMLSTQRQAQQLVNAIDSICLAVTCMMIALS